jgi:PAS domain S-box-containing protein
VSNSDSITAQVEAATLSQGGERIYADGPMADAIRRFPWENTSIQAISAWSETLLCTVNTVLESRFPMLLLWGPEMVVIYNDACIPLLWGRHPRALGQKARDCWSEAWHILEPKLTAVLERGERLYFENELIPIFRDGILTDFYWTYSYSPVRDATGVVRGILDVSHDVTARLATERERDAIAANLKNVLESTTDGLAVLDKQWRYTYVNERGARIVSMQPEDLVGKSVWDIFPLASETKFVQEARQAEQSGQPRHFDAFYPEPHNIWLECHCYPSEYGLSVYFRDVTEQKQTEKALRTSESRFRKLFESDLMGVAIPDRFGAFLESNDELLRMTGYTRADQEAGLVRWDTMTPPEYAELDAAHIQEAAQRGSCTPYEKEYIRKDGTRLPILCGYALLEGSKDEYVGFVLDLSEQKRAERELREREERFRALAETLPQLIWLADAKGVTTYCNHRVAEYFGIAPEELATISWRPRFHPDDVEKIFAAWWHSVETQEPFQVEYRLLRHDGQYRTFLVRAVPVRNEAGEVERWIGSATDIHDQKLAEDALREREQRFRVLAESLPQLVWIRDAGGQYTYCNQRLLDYVGRPAEWLQEQTFEAVHPEDLDTTLQKWKVCLETGVPYENEYRLRRHDGVYRWFLVRGIPMRSEAGHVERWLGSSTEIHDQKLAEDALRRSEKLATAGRLAASIAHEINNPLEAVTNLLYLALQDESLSASTRSYLQTADQELRRVAHITTQTLRFHKQSNAPALIDLCDIVDSVLALFGRRLANKNIELKLECERGTFVNCFADEIRQVVANLISNALDATNWGGRVYVRVSSTRHWKSEPSEWAKIVIADTGLGIPSGIRDRIFEPFVSTKSETGIGLGLWVTDGIVRKHGGHIRIRSRSIPQPCGTVFVTFLPKESPLQNR